MDIGLEFLIVIPNQQYSLVAITSFQVWVKLILQEIHSSLSGTFPVLTKISLSITAKLNICYHSQVNSTTWREFGFIFTLVTVWQLSNLWPSRNSHQLDGNKLRVQLL